MRARILYKKSVYRDLKRIDKAIVRRIMDDVEADLADDPFQNAALKGQFEGLRRHRVGEYRVIYSIIGEDVYILKIAHRKDVYRK